MPIIITGANGFIGRALCQNLPQYDNVLGIDIKRGNFDNKNVKWKIADITDSNIVSDICKKYVSDVVIHCAGIAHQKMGAVESSTYTRVNSEATENLAKSAGKYNPDVQFIFLSSVSVYGEGPQMTSRKGAKALKRKNSSNKGINEDGECWPSSDYAMSKLDAERRLIALSNEGIIRNLLILRLAPVYDREWSLNLDRRVFAPGKLAYLRFGSGSQKMSALARPNLVDFIELLLERSPQTSGVNILNVCDTEHYEFNTIIQVFKKSGIRPNRPVISVSLPAVWLATRIAGLFFPSKRSWLHSGYNKLASSLVFNNEKMMGIGFRPVHSLETVFDAEITE